MTPSSTTTFLEELREQRWDDHRFYHRSRVNQSLHLLSACCFLATYVLLFVNPVAASLFGWFIAMWPRQIGHFWFEPKDFDEVNRVTHDHKEKVKVGFNLQRKVMLFLAFLSVPVIARLSPTFFGALPAWTDATSYLHVCAYAWLGLAGVGLVGRTLYLLVTRGPKTAAAWFTKILTDPFHDILIYWKAPLHLLRGEWIDPMHDVSEEVQKRHAEN